MTAMSLNWLLIAVFVAGCAVEAGGSSSESPAPLPAGFARDGAEQPVGDGRGDETTLEDVDSDPEPPEAQQLAEQVLHAEWNRDAITELTLDTRTRLKMSLTQIVRKTTSFEGRHTGIAAKTDSIEDRLAELQAEVTEQEIKISLSGSVLFDFDSEAIRADAETALASVAEVIRAHPDRPVRIEGHTDSVASDEYNQALSERRAGSVLEWLAGHGVERGRLSASGLGEQVPVADNDTAEGRQQNRRVEITIEKGG